MTSDICYFDSTLSYRDMWVEKNNYRYGLYNYRLCVRRSYLDTYDIYLNDSDLDRLIDFLNFDNISVVEFAKSFKVSNLITNDNIVFYRVRNIVKNFLLPKFLKIHISASVDENKIILKPKFLMSYSKIGIFSKVFFCRTIILDLMDVPRISKRLKELYYSSYTLDSVG